MSELGKLGEDLAAKEYERQGYKIIARNYIFPSGKQSGEIDLICLKGKELVFVEVKLRKSNAFVGPFESVNLSKQRKLVRTVKLYLAHNRQYSDYDYRIDVAAVSIDNNQNSVTILSNAIEDPE